MGMSTINSFLSQSSLDSLSSLQSVQSLTQSTCVSTFRSSLISSQHLPLYYWSVRSGLAVLFRTVPRLFLLQFLASTQTVRFISCPLRLCVVPSHIPPNARPYVCVRPPHSLSARLIAPPPPQTLIPFFTTFASFSFLCLVPLIVYNQPLIVIEIRRCYRHTTTSLSLCNSIGGNWLDGTLFSVVDDQNNRNFHKDTNRG